MEYLNGGDLYSLLRNLGCLDEDIARIYIAEVVSFDSSEIVTFPFIYLFYLLFTSSVGSRSRIPTFLTCGTSRFKA